MVRKPGLNIVIDSEMEKFMVRLIQMPVYRVAAAILGPTKDKFRQWDILTVLSVVLYFTLLKDGYLGGADASGLELRALGHWLAYYDGGEYAELVSDPDRDIHFHNACLFGIHERGKEIPKLTRDLSKRLIYCVLYGGGAKKTGSIIAPKRK